MKASIIFCAFCFAIFGVHAARAESESSSRCLARGLSPLPPRRRLTGGPKQAAPSSTPFQCATKKTLGSSFASIDSAAACTTLTGLGISASSSGEPALQCRPRVFFDLLARQQHRRLLGQVINDRTLFFVFFRQALKQQFSLGPSFFVFTFVLLCTSLIVYASPQLHDTSTASGSRSSNSAVSHAPSSSAPVSRPSPARSSSSASIPRSSASAASAHSSSSSSSLPCSASSSSALRASLASRSSSVASSAPSSSSTSASSPACSSVPHVFSGASVVLVAHCNHNGRVIRRTPHPLLALDCSPDTVVLNYARHHFFGRRAPPARRSTRARLSSPLSASAPGNSGMWETVADIWRNLL
ncbi:hypothetical protein C8R46DRAFT_1040395 [Mycena filopes]|nr:hypothetical protein C8R46DRAFT_1040395 [Mycena filopes]